MLRKMWKFKAFGDSIRLINKMVMDHQSLDGTHSHGMKCWQHCTSVILLPKYITPVWCETILETILHEIILELKEQ